MLFLPEPGKAILKSAFYSYQIVLGPKKAQSYNEGSACKTGNKTNALA
jgi:hypothetical protein